MDTAVLNLPCLGRHGAAALKLVQATVGTVIKTAEDEDPLGVISVLNIQSHQLLKPLQQLKSFLQSKCPQGEQSQFQEVRMQAQQRAVARCVAYVF